MPNGLAAEIHGVVPVDDFIIDSFRPPQINFYNACAEGAENLECGNCIAADFRIDFDIAEIK